MIGWINKRCLLLIHLEHKEDNILFKMAEQLLTPEDMTSLEKEFAEFDAKDVGRKERDAVAELDDFSLTEDETRSQLDLNRDGQYGATIDKEAGALDSSGTLSLYKASVNGNEYLVALNPALADGTSGALESWKFSTSPPARAFARSMRMSRMSFRSNGIGRKKTSS